MYSFNNIARDACRPQRNCHGNIGFPCFVNIDSQPEFSCFGNPSQHSQNAFESACNNFIHNNGPAFQQMADLCAPLAHMFQMKAAMNKTRSDQAGNCCTKGQETKSSKGNNNSTCNEENKQKTDHCPTVQDIIEQAMSAMHGLRETRQTRIWQQQVDCRGFEPRNIKVKIDGHEMLLKAFKKQESEDGARAMSMRKRVPLPENVNTKKIKCKFCQNGILIVEAPYLDKSDENGEDSATKQNVVKELVKFVVPGLEQLVQTLHGLSESDNAENGNEVEKEIEKEFGSDKKDKVEQSGSMPENAEVEDKNDLTLSVEKDKEKIQRETSDGNAAGSTKKDISAVEAETTSNANYIDPEKPIKDLSSSDENGKEIHNPINTFPADGETPRPEEDDVVSNASEDSFVLLSELERENNDNDNQPKRKEDSSALSSKNENKNDFACSNLEKTSTPEHDADENQNNERVLFRLEMPSYNPESMNVSFDNTNRLLSISASKDKVKAGSGVPREAITKTVPVDDDVDVDGLQCYFRDGTLMVTAPRKPDIRHIPIKA